MNIWNLVERSYLKSSQSYILIGSVGDVVVIIGNDNMLVLVLLVCKQIQRDFQCRMTPIVS